MAESHRQLVSELLADASREHRELLERLPVEIAAALPVDAQGVTRAIDHLADAAGLTPDERVQLVRPHAVNPAVLHARVFGAAPLSRGTVIGAFVEGARVRAETLVLLADTIDQERLGNEVRSLLVEHPLPADEAGNESVAALEDAYAAQEDAVRLIAARLDAD